MKIEQKIGVVGNGFVGGAVKFGFSQQVGCDAEVRVYDKDPSKSLHSLEETVNESDIIFCQYQHHLILCLQLILMLAQLHILVLLVKY